MNGDLRGLGQPLDERVVEFVYGELSPAAKAAFSQELARRPELQAQVDQLLALGQHLDHVPVPEPPPDVVADIMAYAASRHRVVASKQGRDRITLADLLGWLTTPQAGLAMAAVLVIAVGVYMGQSARRATEPGSAQEVKETMRPTRTVTAAQAPEPSAKDEAQGEAPKPVVAKPEEKPAATTAPLEPELPQAGAFRSIEPVPGTASRDLDLPVPQRQSPVRGADSDSEAAASVDPAVVSPAAPEESVAAEALAGLSDAEKEQAVEDLGKVAVRTLVDGLDRGGKRNSGAKQAPTKKSQPKSDLKQREEVRPKDPARERKSVARQAVADDPALRSAQRNEMIAQGGAVTGNEDRSPNQELERQKQEYKRDELSVEKAERVIGTTSGESRKWLGNTYDLGEGEAVAKEAPPQNQVAVQVPSVAPQEVNATEEPTAIQPAADEQRGVAKTVVSEAWGVVPSSNMGRPAAVSGSVNRSAETDSLAVQSSKKGKLTVDFGDDNLADETVLAQTDPSPPARPTPAKPVAAPTEAVAVEESEERFDKDGAAGVGFAQNVAGVEGEATGQSDKKASNEETESLDDNNITFHADQKRNQAPAGAQCDQYWVEMMAFEKAGQADKALKLLALFKVGICQGTRSQDDIALHEAQLYIASGKRAKARKVLEKLQKVPAMEEKAMDMMEAIEGEGLSQ